MEFLILPVIENTVDEFREIFCALRDADKGEYARFLLKYVQTVVVDEENPYVEIEIPEKLKKNG